MPFFKRCRRSLRSIQRIPVIDLLSVCFQKMPVVGEKVRRERRWTPAGATPARELVRSTRYHKTTGAFAAIPGAIAPGSLRLSIRVVLSLSRSDQEPAESHICTLDRDSQIFRRKRSIRRPEAAGRKRQNEPQIYANAVSKGVAYHAVLTISKSTCFSLSSTGPEGLKSLNRISR